MGIQRLLGISGSLRKDSFNSSVLANVGRLCEGRITLEIADISSIPVYNDDVYQSGFREIAESW